VNSLLLPPSVFFVIIIIIITRIVFATPLKCFFFLSSIDTSSGMENKRTFGDENGNVWALLHAKRINKGDAELETCLLGGCSHSDDCVTDSYDTQIESTSRAGSIRRAGSSSSSNCTKFLLSSLLQLTLRRNVLMWVMRCWILLYDFIVRLVTVYFYMSSRWH